MLWFSYGVSNLINENHLLGIASFLLLLLLLIILVDTVPLEHFIYEVQKYC